jgi:hypothetical protein
MIFEFYDKNKVGVLLNFFDERLKSKTRFVDYKNEAESRRFYFGHASEVFSVIIQPNDEIEITHKAGAPPTGEFHHHMNVYKKRTENDLKTYLIQIMRDHKINSII